MFTIAWALVLEKGKLQTLLTSYITYLDKTSYLLQASVYEIPLPLGPGKVGWGKPLALTLRMAWKELGWQIAHLFNMFWVHSSFCEQSKSLMPLKSLSGLADSVDDPTIPSKYGRDRGRGIILSGNSHGTVEFLFCPFLNLFVHFLLAGIFLKKKEGFLLY